MEKLIAAGYLITMMVLAIRICDPIRSFRKDLLFSFLALAPAQTRWLRCRYKSKERETINEKRDIYKCNLK